MADTSPSWCARRSTLTLTSSLLLAYLLLLGDQSYQFGFQPRLITRFCYNSPNLSTVNSQCVLCNYYMFDATVLGCTGSTALSVNITTGQAFCVISQCLGQIRQSPVFLGRRRKRDNQEYDQWNNATGEADKYRVVKEVNADINEYESECDE